MFGPSMVSEGLAIIEIRNITIFGEAIERLIQRKYAEEPPVPIRLNSPEVVGYPLEALDAGIEGRVLVWFAVDDEGKVADAEILDGPPILSEWLLERLDRLIERPALDKTGLPTRAWIALEVHFSRAIAEEARERAAAERSRDVSGGKP